MVRPRRSPPIRLPLSRAVSLASPTLPSRRALLAAAGAAIAVSPTAASAAGAGYGAFLARMREEAVAAGVSDAIVAEALALARPNGRVIELDRHQPEFTLTWSEYRARVLPQSRLDEGARQYAAQAGLFGEVTARYRVDPGVIIGIWGLESGFGVKTGSFGVFDSLATLAYDARRAAFFRSELLAALRIADRRAVPVGAMLSSYAGAMGQPQFMPSAYLRYAQSFSASGASSDRADIWRSEPDVFASIANYLAHSGWHQGEPWGQQVRLAGAVDPSLVGRTNERTLGEWEALGVRRSDGARFSRTDVAASLLLPGGPEGEAFLVYRNFAAIRRYNPSDFYALGVGLLGSAST